jgi:hypothetical protein
MLTQFSFELMHYFLRHFVLSIYQKIIYLRYCKYFKKMDWSNIVWLLFGKKNLEKVDLFQEATIEPPQTPQTIWIHIFFLYSLTHLHNNVAV